MQLLCAGRVSRSWSAPALGNALCLLSAHVGRRFWRARIFGTFFLPGPLCRLGPDVTGTLSRFGAGFSFHASLVCCQGPLCLFSSLSVRRDLLIFLYTTDTVAGSSTGTTTRRRMLVCVSLCCDRDCVFLQSIQEHCIVYISKRTRVCMQQTHTYEQTNVPADEHYYLVSTISRNY